MFLRHPLPLMLKTVAGTLVFVQVAWPSIAQATIDNTATATGTPANGAGNVTDDDSESVEVVPKDATIALIKSAVVNTNVTGDPGRVDAGDTITYSYRVENTGNVTLTAVSVTEDNGDFTGDGTLPVPGNETLTTGTVSTDPGGTDGTWDNLAPGEVVTFTATYTILQSDLDDASGQIDNQADVAALDPDGTTSIIDTSGDTNADDNITDTLLPQLPSLQIVKSAPNPTTPRDVGDDIVYSYAVTNTGNVTLTNVSVSDTDNSNQPDLTPAGETLTTGTNSTDPSGNNGVWDNLAPGETVTFTATLTVNQDDIDNPAINP